MAPERGPFAGMAPGQELLVVLLFAAVAVAIVLAAATAFDWTLPAPPAFDITPDPAGELPF